MRTGLAVVLMLGLVGCGEGGGGNDTQGAGPAVNVPQEPQIAVRSDMQNQLHQLTPANRDIGLKRAILDSGLPCRRVTESGYVTEYNRLSMWTATCSDRRGWAIFVGPDGSAQVRPCQDMERLGLPVCRINPNRSPARPAST